MPDVIAVSPLGERDFAQSDGRSSKGDARISDRAAFVHSEGVDVAANLVRHVLPMLSWVRPDWEEVRGGALCRGVSLRGLVVAIPQNALIPGVVRPSVG
jgi:hypothetical protein